MIFSDNLSFFYVLAFIVLFNVVKYFTENKAVKNILLVLGSVVVLTTLTNITSLGIIIGVSVAVFFGGKFLGKLEKPKLFQALFVGVLIFLFVLKNYKIADFDLLQRIGLSYILFRLIHFLIESANKKIHTYDLGSFINYIIFFPTFIAGPIDGYNNFDYWLGSSRKNYDQILFKTGLFKISIGIVKKFFLVPIIAVYASDFALFDVHFTWQIALLWSMFLYSFYIILDFSGYSDIAIGTAYLIGVKTPENFDNPYGANNLSTFWKKWHMTFSDFLFKYVFKPVVVNCSKWFPNAKRLSISLVGYLVTFTICGIWHGPTLNFVYWGLWHGVFLYVYKLWDIYVIGGKSKNLIGVQKKIFNSGGVIITFIVVTVGWVFFNYQTVDIGVISRNFFKPQAKEIAFTTVLVDKKPVFKVDLSNSITHGLDSFKIVLKGGEIGSQIFTGVKPNKEGVYYLQPISLKKTLYQMDVINPKSNQPEVLISSVGYFYKNDFEPSVLQEWLFGENFKSTKGTIEKNNVVVAELTLKEQYKSISLEQKFFDGYGRAIQVNYKKHEEFHINIEYRKLGESNWQTALSNSEAKAGYYHIHGNVEFEGNKRNVAIGTYQIRLQYLSGLCTSDWFYETIEIQENVDN